MAGPFFSEGHFTKNTKAEVDEMMQNLEAWTNGLGPSVHELQERHQAYDAGQAVVGNLEATAQPLDLQRFMGSWYVIGHVPTFLDKNTSNGVETYTWNEEKQRIDVLFTYMDLERTKMSRVEQKAWPVSESNSRWQLRLKLGFIPVTMPYLILDCDQEYSTCVIGVPNRSALYIMARTTSLESDVYKHLVNVAERAGYDRSLIKEVPQVWADMDPQVCEEALSQSKVMPEMDIDETFLNQRLAAS